MSGSIEPLFYCGLNCGDLETSGVLGGGMVPVVEGEAGGAGEAGEASTGFDEAGKIGGLSGRG
jgi:hypothetical protein